MAKRTLRKPKKSKTSLAKKIQRSNRKKMSNSRSKRKTRSKRLRSSGRRMSDKALTRSRSKQKKSKRRGKILRGGVNSPVPDASIDDSSGSLQSSISAESGVRAMDAQASRAFQAALDAAAPSPSLDSPLDGLPPLMVQNWLDQTSGPGAASAQQFAAAPLASPLAQTPVAPGTPPSSTPSAASAQPRRVPSPPQVPVRRGATGMSTLDALRDRNTRRKRAREVGIPQAAASMGLSGMAKRSRDRRKRFRTAGNRAAQVMRWQPPPPNSMVQQTMRDQIFRERDAAAREATLLDQALSSIAGYFVHSEPTGSFQQQGRPGSPRQHPEAGPTVAQNMLGFDGARKAQRLQYPAAIAATIAAAAAPFASGLFPAAAPLASGLSAVGQAVVAQKLFDYGKGWLGQYVSNFAKQFVIQDAVSKPVEDRLVSRIMNGLNVNADTNIFDLEDINLRLTQFAIEEGIITAPAADSSFLFKDIVTQLITKINNEMRKGNENFNWLIEDYESKGTRVASTRGIMTKPEEKIDCYSLISIFAYLLKDNIQELKEIIPPNTIQHIKENPNILCEIIINFLKGINPSSILEGEETSRNMDMLERVNHIYKFLVFNPEDLREKEIRAHKIKGRQIWTAITAEEI